MSLDPLNMAGRSKVTNGGLLDRFKVSGVGTQPEEIQRWLKSDFAGYLLGLTFELGSIFLIFLDSLSSELLTSIRSIFLFLLLLIKFD